MYTEESRLPLLVISVATGAIKAHTTDTLGGRSKSDDLPAWAEETEAKECSQQLMHSVMMHTKRAHTLP